METMVLKSESKQKQKLSELLTPSAISLDLKGQTKQEIIDELIDILDRAGYLTDKAAVREAVIEREAKLSTGLGEGVAVPHGKTAGEKDLSPLSASNAMGFILTRRTVNLPNYFLCWSHPNR